METNVPVSDYIIKVIGLLSDLPENSGHSLDKLFKQYNFQRDLYPIDIKGDHDEYGENFLKNYFYPSFRNLMFLNPKSTSNARYINNDVKAITLLTSPENTATGSPAETKTIEIQQTELYIFGDYISLFSVDIRIVENITDLASLERTLFAIRKFETKTTEDINWSEWISQNLLCNGLFKLTGPTVKADDYSGSKFKLYSVIDLQENSNTEELLFDISTVSKLGSAAGNKSGSPSRKYYEELLNNNKISIFQNWHALCLFDSFTCIGTHQLNSYGGKKSWSYTYFRIYIYRLFIKYNLYKFNSTIFEEKDLIKLRNQFQLFLNNYNLSHISFNFLGNELYSKIGKALDLDLELQSFEKRINQISAMIIEGKQSRTNRLLEIVTILSAIGSIVPLILTLNSMSKNWGPNILLAVPYFVIITILGLIFFYNKDLLNIRKWFQRK